MWIRELDKLADAFKLDLQKNFPNIAVDDRYDQVEKQPV